MFYFLSNWKSLANRQWVENVAGVERSIIGNILNIIRIAGTGIAIVMLTVMAFSYFMSDGKSFPGSIEKKADVKGNQLINYCIGVAIFIGASNILYYVSILVIDVVDAMIN